MKPVEALQKKKFTDRSKAVLFCGLFMLFLSCFVCFCTGLFIEALWSPAGK